jgi:hypothetical protein
MKEEWKSGIVTANRTNGRDATSREGTQNPGNGLKRRHLSRLATCSVLGLAAACHLPGIPASWTPEEPVPAVTEDSTIPDDAVCKPNTLSCLSHAVQLCNEDGSDFRITPCQAFETCVQGECLPIENTCSEGQPFGLSRRELTFDNPEDPKVQTEEVVLTNCGTTYLFVTNVEVDTPDAPSGAVIYSLSADTLKEVRLPPGGQAGFRVQYRPEPLHARITGTLDVDILGTGKLEIPLRTRVFCVTATPEIEFAIIDYGENVRPEHGLVVHNCGTEPVTLEEIVSDASESPIELTPTLDSPIVLGPGEHARFELHLDEAHRSRIDETRTFVFNQKGVVDPQTRIKGWVALAPCEERELPFLSINEIFARDGDYLSIAPLEVVQARQTSAHSVSEVLLLQVYEQPRHSRMRIELKGQDALWRFPAVGKYTLLYYTFEPQTGQRTCSTGLLHFDVYPNEGLYVELLWSTPEDPIQGDVGFAHGIDLDLHVLSSLDENVGWNDDADCYSTGDCGSFAESELVSHSLTGSHPEVITVKTLSPLVHKIGVYSVSPFHYVKATAQIRVICQDFDYFEDIDLEKVIVANEFWHVGILNGLCRWTTVDSITDGFPR